MFINRWALKNLFCTHSHINCSWQDFASKVAFTDINRTRTSLYKDTLERKCDIKTSRISSSLKRIWKINVCFLNGDGIVGHGSSESGKTRIQGLAMHRCEGPCSWVFQSLRKDHVFDMSTWDTTQHFVVPNTYFDSLLSQNKLLVTTWLSF